MGNYSEKMENIFNNMAFDDEITIEKILEFLNTPESFRSFGDGLKSIMVEKYPQYEDVILQNPKAFIKERCKANGVNEREICDSDNTLTNWFRTRDERTGVKEGGPKGGETNRKKLFALSFALDLNVEETIYLFHNVYFDRAFNVKNTDEMIYYFCKKNCRSWNDAKRLIEKTNEIIFEEANQESNTVPTKYIKEELDKTESEEELLEYVLEHVRDLRKKNVAAKRAFQDQKEFAFNNANKEANRYKNTGEKKQKNSMAFLYTTIVEQPNTKLYKSRKDSQKNIFVRGSKTVFGKNARIRDSIKSNFPEVSKLTKEDLNNEEIRKIIIFLFSYNYWYDNESADIEEYREMLDGILDNAGLSKLYYGNPFDWLFLYCTVDEYNPLDKFRDIIAEILEDDENEFSK